MLDDIKKYFVHGYLDDDDGQPMFRANGKRIPIRIKKAVSGETKTEELPVSDSSCNIQPATPELTEKREVVVENAVETPVAVETLPEPAEEAHEQIVKPTEAVPAETVCCGDPKGCEYSKYSQSMNGYYKYYCNRAGVPLPCDAPGANQYEKHYTAYDGREPGEDRDEEKVFTDDDFVEEDDKEAQYD